MARRAEQNAESDRRLLEALVALVAEKGYEATTAAEIGLRAGFSRAMVHARYGTKDALLDELMRTEYEQRLVPDVADNADGLQRVQAIIERMDQLATEDEQFLKSMFKLNFEAVRGSPALTPRITRWLTALEDSVRQALEDGKKDGSVRTDLDAAAAARDIFVTGTGIAYTWIVLPGTNYHEELARWRLRIAADCGRPVRPSTDRRTRL
jgi:AcrR family transcriptional regulator